MVLEAIEIQEMDIPKIVSLLGDMHAELQEFDFNSSVVTQAIQRDLPLGVKWFLFRKNNKDIGMCHMQGLHNYWRLEKRYYIGGFYIMPEYRGQGYFGKIYDLLKKWAVQNDGVQIYCHIHKCNDKSIKAFESVGMQEEGYKLMINHWGRD